MSIFHYNNPDSLCHQLHIQKNIKINHHGTVQIQFSNVCISNEKRGKKYIHKPLHFSVKVLSNNPQIQQFVHPKRNIKTYQFGCHKVGKKKTQNKTKPKINK